MGGMTRQAKPPPGADPLWKTTIRVPTLSRPDAAQDEQGPVIHLARRQIDGAIEHPVAMALGIQQALLGVPLPRARLLEERVGGPAGLGREHQAAVLLEVRH